MSATLDLVAIGRVSVDLYGQQIGSRLEDVATFAKAVGGCPANIAIGAARLGLRAALITRVGDEPMGRFVREQLAREGVDTRGVQVDSQRLTPLVLLSVRDQETFPLIFYRENCADSVLAPDDIDAGLVAGARALLVTGTHFSFAGGALAQRKAIGIARAHGRRVILDIDYRPNLWGIGGHDAGASRYARSARVTEALAAVLPECDLIVGTEEEMHIAAGAEDTLEAVRRIRARSRAVIVVKRGAAGCVVFAHGIPPRLEEALVVAGMPIEVYNVLGAGDAFLAGFLRGYLRDEPHEQSARYGNACGAIAVSRLLCSSEFPSLTELEYYLEHGSSQPALRFDAELNHLHWATTGRGAAAGLPGGIGVVLDASAGTDARRSALPQGLWVAREVREAESLAASLVEWPGGVVVACRLRQWQEVGLGRLFSACRAQRRELLIAVDAEPAAPAMTRVYQLGVRPDWWALGASTDRPDLEACARVIAAGDPYCRGVLLVLDVVLDGVDELTDVQPPPAPRDPIVRGLLVRGSILEETDAAAQLRKLATAWITAKDGR